MTWTAGHAASTIRPLRLLAVACAVGLASWAPTLHAQAGKHGAYVGTAKITYSEGEPPNHVLYRGEVKITIPLVSASARSARGELDDVAKPSATAQITHLEKSQRATAHDSAGRINTTTCKLAAPAEVPMMVQGGLDVDYRKKTYGMYFALLSVKEVALDCAHSTSGPFKKKEGVILSLGTHEAGLDHPGLPFTDPARLVAKHSMVAGPGMKDKRAKVEQEWDLQLRR